MKKVLLLATGGTIACTHSEEGLTPGMSGDGILDWMPELREGFAIESRDILNLDSSNIQPEEWQFMAEQVAEALKTGAGLPDAVARVIRAFADPEGEDAEQVDLARGFENALFAAYYDVCEHSSCRFLREWSEFDRTLRNITAALAARAAQRPVDSVTVGGGDVVEQLQRSSAADFGLRGELPYIDAVITAVNDESNMLEKERKIDMVRWEMAGELAAFDYFNIGAVLSYLAKINIVARWSVLDPKRGREIFERLMAELDGKDLINKQ